MTETHSVHAASPARSGLTVVDAAGFALIFCLTLTAYSLSLFGKPIWDDENYLTKPALQSLHGLWRIWFELGTTQQYFPLLHSAFWLEHRFWGDAVLGYHLTNIAMHSISACLVVLIVRRLNLTGSWMAGLIFALHPVCVESVAWISEQKNALSGVLFLAAGYTYLHFDKSRRVSVYFLALGLFILSLLSKSVTATLPGALLVVLWWRRGKVEWKHDVAPLVPWFGLGSAFGLFTAWVERTYIGAQGVNFTMTLLERCLLACRILCFYFSKLVWPSGLIFSYPKWTMDTGQWWQYLFVAGCLAAAACCLELARRHYRGPLAALLFYAGTLLPALGFLNVFYFLYSYVADHFQYLAMLGIIVPAGSAVTLGASWLGKRLRFLEVAVCGLLLLGLGVLTWKQTAMYTDMETLWRTTVTKNPRSFMAYNNLGLLKLKEGWIGEALLYFQVAVMLNPNFAEANNNLGNGLRANQRLEEAIAAFKKATALRPNVAAFHGDLANTLAEAGRMKEAISQYDLALAIDPNDARLSNNLAWMLSTSPDSTIRNGPRAVDLAKKAVQLLGNTDPTSTATLAAAYAETGRFEEAVTTAEKARTLAVNAGSANQTPWINGLLELFRARQPYHGG